MKRGQILFLQARRRHSDGGVHMHYAESPNLQTLPAHVEREFDTPDKFADYLVELAGNLRTKKPRKAKTG